MRNTHLCIRSCATCRWHAHRAEGFSCSDLSYTLSQSFTNVNRLPHFGLASNFGGPVCIRTSGGFALWWLHVQNALMHPLLCNLPLACAQGRGFLLCSDLSYTLIVSQSFTNANRLPHFGLASNLGGPVFIRTSGGFAL